MNRKQNRNWLLATLLAVSSTTLLAGTAQAEEVNGSFTLPYTVHWGAATLPAGHYSFGAKSSANPFMVTVRGEGKAAMIMARGSSLQGKGQSSLRVVREGNQVFVSSLQLAPYGMTFEYGPGPRRHVEIEASNRSTGKPPERNTRTVAQARVIEIPLALTAE